MTPNDLDHLRKLAQHLPDFKRVGVFSPIRDGEYLAFPGLIPLSRRRWDLNQPGHHTFDLLIASSVFMYSPDPQRWFRHVLASCKYFVLLDLVRRQRTEGHEFGTDGDCLRFEIGDEKPRVEPSFDLASLGNRLLAVKTFWGGANDFDKEPLHVIALFRGDLATPILRIDDYPTAIRPILPDLSPLHDVLEKVDSYGVAYHLGIVPALLNQEMITFLKGLKHMIPAVHGYDHGYFHYAPILEARNDPFNQQATSPINKAKGLFLKLGGLPNKYQGQFNEFEGQDYDTILAKLQDGRRMLEDALGKTAEVYIPPCNLGDRKTGQALVEAGFRAYFSEKAIPGCNLPWVRSQFYGCSPQYDNPEGTEAVTLHTTWEWDVVRQGDTQSLDRLMTHLANRQAKAQALEQQMVAIWDTL